MLIGAKRKSRFFGIGIRREDKNEWERRTPLTPADVKELKENHSIQTWLQPSRIRSFSDSEYTQVEAKRKSRFIGVGAKIQEDLSPCPIIFAIKEIPVDFFEPKKTYVFFSHTIKGQPRNMPMLRQMLDLKCQLIDYEKIVDEHGHRLIFFGRYAGLAGMIDTLWALGQRLNYEGIKSPFSRIRKAYEYKSLKQAKDEIAKLGKKISALGLPNSLTPLICGFAGYGNVSQGAQEIIDLLPTREIEPDELAKASLEGSTGILPVKQKKDNKVIYKVVFKEEHMVEPITDNRQPITDFELQDYYDHPEKYQGVFERYIPHLTLLINCIYWDSRYPRLLTKKYLKDLFKKTPRLRVIGDISCDVEGAIECTVHTTDPGNPVFVYNPFNKKTTPGVEGLGPVVLAVDHLPCELPRESSTYFSEVLKPFIPEIVKADFSVDFKQCKLPPPIKNAVILYHGALTPNYKYLSKYL